MPRSSGLSGWGVDDSSMESMPLPKRDKLVRDRIPQIIRSKGGSPKTHRAGASEYRRRLAQKLVEEAMEYSQSRDPKELADLLEVVRSLCTVHRTTFGKLERMRAAKARERGTFSKRIILDDA
jgi:predicted house-cleaning noncanonical NTP pyrophosphatase (MazG superfamily)